MAALDFFMVSPGDKKRAALDLQNKIKLAEKAAEIERLRALALRDSDQLNQTFQRNKQERDMQETLGRMFPTNNPELTADENSTLSLIHARDKMDEIKASGPLMQSSSAMNQYGQSEGSRPFSYDQGRTSALSGIAGNQAGQSASLLQSAINQARMGSAPGAARAMDDAQETNAVNEIRKGVAQRPLTYDLGRTNAEATIAGNRATEAEAANRAELSAAERPFLSDLGKTSVAAKITGNTTSAILDTLKGVVGNARMQSAPSAAPLMDQAQAAEAINTYKEAQAKDTTIPARTQATVSSAFGDARKGDFQQGFFNNRDPKQAAQAENMQDLQNISLYEYLKQNPAFSAQIRYPDPRTAVMMNLLGGGGTNTSALPGGLTPAIQAPKPTGIKAR